MSHRKQPSKRKLTPTLGAAGLSLSLAGGVSVASAAPTADIQTQSTKVSHEITLYEEEISDVSLGTFYVFDKEKVRPTWPKARAGRRVRLLAIRHSPEARYHTGRRTR